MTIELLVYEIAKNCDMEAILLESMTQEAPVEISYFPVEELEVGDDTASSLEIKFLDALFLSFDNGATPSFINNEFYIDVEVPK